MYQYSTFDCLSWAADVINLQALHPFGARCWLARHGGRAGQTARGGEQCPSLALAYVQHWSGQRTKASRVRWAQAGLRSSAHFASTSCSKLEQTTCGVHVFVANLTMYFVYSMNLPKLITTLWQNKYNIILQVIYFLKELKYVD